MATTEMTVMLARLLAERPRCGCPFNVSTRPASPPFAHGMH